MSLSKFDLALQVTGSFNQTELKVKSATDFALSLKPNESLSAARILNLITGDADRTITLSGNPTLNDWFNQSVKSSASPSFVALSTSAAIPLLLTNGQLVNIALTSQTTGATTLTIPDFAGVADEFTFKTKAQTLSNKTFIAPALGVPSSGIATNLTGLPEGGLSLTDIATNDVSTTKHGFAPKLPNDATKYLDGTGAYSAPAGSTAATQAEQETATSTTTFVSPARQKFHPSAAKAWVNFNGTGTVTIKASYNVSSITDNGTGDYTVNFTTAFSSAEYGSSISAKATSGVAGSCRQTTKAAGSYRFVTTDTSGNVLDVPSVDAIFFGDQ